MGDTSFPVAVAERGRDWQSLGKRPRAEYEYDRSLSGVYVGRREEEHRLSDRGGNSVGVRLLRDHVYAPAPSNYIDDHRFVRDQNELLSSSRRLTVSERLNLMSDSRRLDPSIGRRLALDE